MANRAFLRHGATVLALLGVLFPTASTAAWSVNPAVNTPIVKHEATQRTFDIVSDRVGGSITVWQDSRLGADIYAQRMGRKGTERWLHNGVPVTDEAETQRNPVAVTDGRNGVIALWEDNRDGDYDIYAQRIAKGGSAQWRVNGNRVNGATGDQSGIAAVHDGRGGAFVVWVDQRGDDRDIYAQRVRPNGKLAWPSGGVRVATAVEDQTSPVIVPDGLGGVVVAWLDRRDDGGYTDVYAQRIRWNGSRVWQTDGVPVVNNTNSKDHLRMVFSPAGGPYLVWEESRFDDRDIFAQRLGVVQGTRRWGVDGIRVTGATGQQDNPELARDGRGGIIVTWDDARGDDRDIYVQRVDLSGQIKWRANGVAVATAQSDQELPQIISDHRRGAIVVWEDERRNTAGDIFAGRIRPQGGVGLQRWPAKGLAISTAPETQEKPQLVTDGRFGAIFAWEDERNGNDDLYSAQVHVTGARGQTPDLTGDEQIFDDDTDDAF